MGSLSWAQTEIKNECIPSENNSNICWLNVTDAPEGDFACLSIKENKADGTIWCSQKWTPLAKVSGQEGYWEQMQAAKAQRYGKPMSFEECMRLKGFDLMVVTSPGDSLLGFAYDVALAQCSGR